MSRSKFVIDLDCETEFWLDASARRAILLNEERYAILDEPRTASGKAIGCKQCGMVSHHPSDVANLYCANCYEFLGDDRPRTIKGVAIAFTEQERIALLTAAKMCLTGEGPQDALRTACAKLEVSVHEQIYEKILNSLSVPKHLIEPGRDPLVDPDGD